MFTITSPAFADHGAIPAAHTCEGSNVAPPLAWKDLPPGTRSLALIVDDPDAPDPAAPKRVWVHWVVADLPASAGGLAEGQLPAGAHVGQNDWQHTKWEGPCPPIGRHRYFFKLYALDQPLGLEHPTKAQLEQAMKGHILGQATLMGTYQKQK